MYETIVVCIGVRGILLDFTIPYSSQLNVRAERLNRTLLEKTRGLIFDSYLNKELYGVNQLMFRLTEI